MHLRILSFIIIICFLGLISCVERGKPIKKESTEQTKKNTKQKLAHYTCPNGHAGSDKQGVCPECKTAYIHNQAFHGLNIPKDAIKDPFQTGTNTNTSNSSPAQNTYGDYHYTCPNGHDGGSGSADNCTTCQTKLVHNQLYHK